MTEYFARPLGSYDPNEPLVVPYSDLIAARNAVSELVQLVSDTTNPPSEYQELSLRLGVLMGVTPEPSQFDTLAEAIAWLVGLRDRLSSYLPDLPPTPGP